MKNYKIKTTTEEGKNEYYNDAVLSVIVTEDKNKFGFNFYKSAKYFNEVSFEDKNNVLKQIIGRITIEYIKLKLEENGLNHYIDKIDENLEIDVIGDLLTEEIDGKFIKKLKQHDKGKKEK